MREYDRTQPQPSAARPTGAARAPHLYSGGPKGTIAVTGPIHAGAVRLS
ncbi:hypothetical protein ACGGAQ_16090 [Micromonospora sp. NPDC047557]